MTKKSAWVVYWDATNDNDDQDVIAIFDSRKSYVNIEEFVLDYYISQKASLEEMFDYCSRKAQFPYQVQYDNVNGVRWTSRMFCGHNPFIVAECVTNLSIVADDNGVERLTWDALPRPTLQVV